MAIAESREIVVKKTIHDDPWVRAEVVDVEFDTGKKISDFLLLTGKNGGFVSVCARLSDGRFLLVRQCKPAAGLTIESAAGNREEGEAQEEAARRELLEETGYVAERMVRVGRGIFSLTNRIDSLCHLYLAFDCKESDETMGGDEVQGVERIILSPVEALNLIDNGEIKDMPTIAGIYAHLLHEKGVPVGACG